MRTLRPHVLTLPLPEGGQVMDPKQPSRVQEGVKFTPHATKDTHPLAITFLEDPRNVCDIVVKQSHEATLALYEVKVVKLDESNPVEVFSAHGTGVCVYTPQGKYECGEP